MEKATTSEEIHFPAPAEIQAAVSDPASARPYLERLRLDEPSGAKEKLMQRAVVLALSAIDAL